MQSLSLTSLCKTFNISNDNGLLNKWGLDFNRVRFINAISSIDVNKSVINLMNNNNNK
jgi:hypothetical protein